jgi:hypothetical protein
LGAKLGYDRLTGWVLKYFQGGRKGYTPEALERKEQHPSHYEYAAN